MANTWKKNSEIKGHLETSKNQNDLYFLKCDIVNQKTVQQGLQRSRQRDFHSRIPFSAFIMECIWALEDPQNSQMYLPCTCSQEESHRGETLPRKWGIQPRGEEPLGWNRESECSGWPPHPARCRKTGAGGGFSLISLFLSPFLFTFSLLGNLPVTLQNLSRAWPSSISPVNTLVHPIARITVVS